jgi:polar amino acid transport system ATP-binding protein
MNDRTVSQDTRLLRVRDLQKSYGHAVVLKNISFEVHSGRSVVVIGPSGSGKSTLLRCVNLLENIDCGMIEFMGRDIAAARAEAHRIRSDIGMVFQNFELFPHLTALENIALAPMKVRGMSTRDAYERGRELLAKVHIPEKADAFPEELSGGQQQRVAIARALAMNPKLMLYDEPTSALDPEMIKEVLDVMLELSEEGMTSIVVTHEMNFARRAADHIVFMDQGEIVEDAPADQFFTDSVHPRTRKFLQQILH